MTRLTTTTNWLGQETGQSDKGITTTNWLGQETGQSDKGIATTNWLGQETGQGDTLAAMTSRWQRMECGSGRLDLSAGGLRLVKGAASAQQYSNAQIDDYQGLPRRRLPWSPPLALTVRARFSHPGPALDGPCPCDFIYPPAGDGGPILSGTAGFGFWNDPWAPGRRLPALPRALWFFYASPPSNMKLDLRTPGCGWKAAAIDASRGPALLLAPAAPLAVPLMNLPPLYGRLWPAIQRAVGVNEASIHGDMTGWRTYRIEWGRRRARFLVDGAPVLDCAAPPRGPLGLVIWLDNQALVVTPQGRLRHSLLATSSEQWLELAGVAVEQPGAR